MSIADTNVHIPTIQDQPMRWTRNDVGKLATVGTSRRFTACGRIVAVHPERGVCVEFLDRDFPGAWMMQTEVTRHA